MTLKRCSKRRITKKSRKRGRKRVMAQTKNRAKRNPIRVVAIVLGRVTSHGSVVGPKIVSTDERVESLGINRVPETDTRAVDLKTNGVVRGLL